MERKQLELYLENPQTIPLYVLAEISEQKGLYHEIIAKEFAGAKNVFGKKRLYSQKPLTFENEGYIDSKYLESSHDLYFEECEKRKVQEELYLQKKDIYEEKYCEYLRVKKELKAAKKELDKAKQQFDEKSSSINKLLKKICEFETISSDLEYVVLVHKSATTNQLKRYQTRKMVITNTDFPILNSIGVSDEVFEENSVIISLPYDMVDRDLSLEEKSAFAFANMVFFYKIGQIAEFDAIFSDKIVSKILRFNNYESYN